MAGPEGSVGAQTTRLGTRIGNLAVLYRPSTRCAGLWSRFCLLLRFSGSGVRHEGSSSLISRELQASHHHAKGCRLLVDLVRLGLG